MGVERSVTRWHIQHQLLEYELARLEAQLEQGQARPEDSVATPQVVLAEGDGGTPEELFQKVAMTREKLKALGHCPKPMMG